MTTSATSDHHQMSQAGGAYVQRGSRPREEGYHVTYPMMHVMYILPPALPPGQHD